MPLYYQNQTLSDMERSLRALYLTDSGWLESADKKLAVRDNLPLPWFTYSAIEFLSRNISADLTVFEYGGGQSTLWWSSNVREVVTVEHDPEFFQYIEKNVPENAKLYLREENSSLHSLPNKSWVEEVPIIPDPEQNLEEQRSGQVNNSFHSYALTLAEFDHNYFDIIVIDGRARSLSTWVAIQHFNKNGFIIFDNSDRNIYQPAYDFLNEAGYRRIDFWGLGPINPYGWCTSVFYQPKDFISTRWFG